MCNGRFSPVTEAAGIAASLLYFVYVDSLEEVEKNVSGTERIKKRTVVGRRGFLYA